jgi:outer membrane protein OmpA-like peptidoglycan-associated protein
MAAYEYFRANNIAPERMEIVGYGESQPVADNIACGRVAHSIGEWKSP